VPDYLFTMIAFGLCYLACALFALMQPAHWRAVSHDALPARTRCTGWLAATLLLGALAIMIGTEGPAFGALLGVMLASAAALTLTFTLSWKPGLLRPLARLLEPAQC